eukprot:TRINITY_DN2920_c0_g1_i1.p1 TRINITY_DN2920_c0_g1~~TRINITY_DN2920_c0_g1_i1.p1  ORF type:complete len:273 (-),score=74.20 TRINITY_DN2920_c0_g1_i1:101-871(-)
MATTAIAPSDIYPVLRRFLAEAGLQRTLKAFDKETLVDDESEQPKMTKAKKALAKLLADLELTEACQNWLESRTSCLATVTPTVVEQEVVATDGHAVQQEESKSEKRKAKKRAAAEAEAKAAETASAGPVAEEEEEEGEEPRAPKRKREEQPTANGREKEGKTKNRAAENTSGVPFSRVDAEKWTATVKDTRLLDNTHKALGGDNWGDKASEDLLKVKGKGFRKEMAKKKRASWRGGGEIDQRVLSVKFDDSSDED